MNGTLPRFIVPAAALLVAASSFAQQASQDADFVAPKPKKANELRLRSLHNLAFAIIQGPCHKKETKNTTDVGKYLILKEQIK